MKRIRKIYEQQRDKELAEIKEKLLVTLNSYKEYLKDKNRPNWEVLGNIKVDVLQIFKQAGVEVKKDG